MSDEPKVYPIEPGEPEESEDVRALKERLAAARTKRAELERRREERDALHALEKQVLEEELAIADAEVLERAEAEHGELGVRIAKVHTRLGVIVVKRPNPVAFKKFMDVGDTKTLALMKLIRPCLVHPDVSGFDRVVDELPGVIVTVADALTELVTVRGKEVAGK